jgi:hypothetical protein
MSLLVIGIAIVWGLLLAAGTVALFSLWRAHALVRELKERANRREQDNKKLGDRLESLGTRLQQLETAPAPVAVVPAAPRAGMNLNKRSQVLRLHRQGEAPERIAATLDIPRQEVDLLIKVHRIVMANV